MDGGSEGVIGTAKPPDRGGKDEPTDLRKQTARMPITRPQELGEGEDELPLAGRG